MRSHAANQMSKPLAESYQLPSFIRARVISANGSVHSLERVNWLTPYEAETIGDDALHAGPGARLEVTVPRATDLNVAAVTTLFEWLRERGIEVAVRRDVESQDDA
jgi:hypothetical protein